MPTPILPQKSGIVHHSNFGVLMSAVGLERMAEAVRVVERFGERKCLRETVNRASLIPR